MARARRTASSATVIAGTSHSVAIAATTSCSGCTFTTLPLSRLPILTGTTPQRVRGRTKVRSSSARMHVSLRTPRLVVSCRELDHSCSAISTRGGCHLTVHLCSVCLFFYICVPSAYRARERTSKMILVRASVVASSSSQTTPRITPSRPCREHTFSPSKKNKVMDIRAREKQLRQDRRRPTYFSRDADTPHSPREGILRSETGSIADAPTFFMKIGVV